MTEVYSFLNLYLHFSEEQVVHSVRCNSLFCQIRQSILGRIQDLTKGGSDKSPPKAVAPRGSGGILPLNIFNFRASECDFQRFQGQFEVV